MNLGIMQPYFLPYLGYFQLINYCDSFIVYDDIEFSKKGWIQRNRIICNGEPAYIGLPLKKASDFEHIVRRELAETWEKEKKKLLSRVLQNYRKAPNFESVYALFKQLLEYKDPNLFRFLSNSLQLVCRYINIETPIVSSSSIEPNNQFSGEERVIHLCKLMGATTYINPIGGVGLYHQQHFLDHHLSLAFLEYQPYQYSQNQSKFYSHLSILDVLMWNDLSSVQRMLCEDFHLIGDARVSVE